ncbi:helix-turn-helix domain-containing protein [Streptomyces sp. NPDC086787]|uniref:helix-turn-helix domain-containing protein n=1 Tax=Streptomyces sp. NPDC086787 TaxID=3365759 RepID=UPI003804DAF2
MAALESGRAGSYRQAAELFGVSQRSVGTWWRACQARGPGGTAAGEGAYGPG